jgi:adenylylsulfate kinase
MTTRILVMGLPGSGKTTFSEELVKRLMLKHTVKWFNADAVRKEHNDWDFTSEGRLRQVNRMREMADKSGAEYVICDFVCPTDEYRQVFDADYLVWMDTIAEGRFADTNKLFEAPTEYNFRVRDWAENEKILDLILKQDLPKDSNLRSIVKAISWRAVGTLDTFVLSWLITGEVKLAVAIGGTEVFTKMFLYWAHERVWNKIKFGKTT